MWESPQPLKGSSKSSLTKQKIFQSSQLGVVLFLTFICMPSAFGNLQETQPLLIQGSVFSAADNLPLQGVNIIEEGTANGVITDKDGKYRIYIRNVGSVLVYSYLGYATQEVRISDQKEINIYLLEDAERLDEVIVIGYGTVKKSDLTGAVASISAEDLKRQSHTSIDQVLQGKAAGIEVINSSGLPGAGSSIKIRGVGTFYNTEPLFVIDGIQFTNSGGEQANPLSLINPQDIESIEILKDASATAIYGSRAAANGVVIITTKHGSQGKLRISYDGYVGLAAPWKTMDLLNADQYLELMSDIQLNANPGATEDSYFSNFPKLWQDGDWNPGARQNVTDWQKEVLRTAVQTDHHLAFSGGSEKMTYHLSTGYSNKDGTLEGYNYTRYTTRISTDFNLASWIRFGQNINIGYKKTTTIDGGLLLQAIQMPVYSPVYDSTNLGGFAKVTTTDDLNDQMNPVSVIELSERYRKDLRLIGNIYTELEPIKGLTYRFSLGMDMNYGNSYLYQPAQQQGNLSLQSFLSESYSYSQSPLIENTLTFHKEAGKHEITVMLGNSYRNRAISRYVDLEGRDFANDEIRVLSVADVSTITSSGAGEEALLAYFGRVSYAFSKKYLATATIRRDASPNFDPANRWATFPSFSLGWKIHEESFMDNLDPVSELKIRGSWGQSGRDVGGLKYFATLHSHGVGYVFGTENIFHSGVTVLSPPSTGIRWETSTSTNIGLDIGLFENRFRLTTDLFSILTRDILVPIPIPPSVGFGLSYGSSSSPTVNAADVNNKGIELTVGWQDNIGNLHYSINTNTTFIKNKVISMGDGEPINSWGGRGGYSLTRTEGGFPIGYFYGFVVDKVYSTQDEVNADNAAAPGGVYQAGAAAGDIRFEDINGRDENGELTGLPDGKLDDDDRQMIGKPIPTATYGLQLNVNYKGLDLAVLIQGIADADIYNENGYWLTGMTRPFNSSSDVVERWRQEGDVSEIPRAVNGDPARNTRASTRYVEDGSYARIKNLTLGYELPINKIFRITTENISLFRVYLSAQNLITLTRYSGFDPEVRADYNLGRGIDTNRYPQPRTCILGIQLSF